MTRNELLGQLKRGNFNMLKQFPGLSVDSSLMIEAYELNPEILDYIDNSLMKDEDFFYELALINPELLKGSEFAGKKDFMKRLVSQIPEAAKYMQKRLYNDPVFVVELAAVGAERVLIETMNKNPEIKSVLQKLDFNTYKHVDEYEISRQEEMIARGEINDELANNADFMAKAIEKDSEYINKLGINILNDFDAFENIYRSNEKAFDNYIDSGYNNKNNVKMEPLEMANEVRENDTLDAIENAWLEEAQRLYDELENTTDENEKENIQRELSKKMKHLDRFYKDIKTSEGRKHQLKLAERLTLSNAKVSETVKNKSEQRKKSNDLIIVMKAEQIKEIEKKDAKEMQKELNDILKKVDPELYKQLKMKAGNKKSVLEYLTENPNKLELYSKNSKFDFVKRIANGYNNVKEKSTDKITYKKPETVMEGLEILKKNKVVRMLFKGIRERKKDIEGKMKTASEAERSELEKELSTLNSKEGKIGKEVREGRLTANANKMIEELGNKELDREKVKRDMALTVIVMDKINSGKKVSREELSQVKNHFNYRLKEEYPEVNDKIGKMIDKDSKQRNYIENIVRNPENYQEVLEMVPQDKKDAFKELVEDASKIMDAYKTKDRGEKKEERVQENDTKQNASEKADREK